MISISVTSVAPAFLMDSVITVSPNWRMELRDGDLVMESAVVSRWVGITCAGVVPADGITSIATVLDLDVW